MASRTDPEGRDGERQTPPDAAHGEQAERPDGDELLDVRVVRTRAWMRFGWAAGSLLALASVVWLAVAVPTVSVPLLVAFIVAYFLEPVLRALTARGVPRTLAIVLVLLGGLLIVAGALALLGPQIADELADLPDKLQTILVSTMRWAEATFAVDLETARTAIADFAREQLQTLDERAVVDPLRNVLRAVYGGAKGTLSVIVGIAMTFVFLFFMMRDYGRVIAAVHDLVPRRHRDAVAARAREIDRALSSFLRGQLLVAAILAVLYTSGFLIVGTPLAAVVGLISGAGNVIPYVGTTIGAVLATGLVLIEDPGWPMLLGTWGVFAVVQLLEGWVITPKIVGESVDLSPFVVIVAVLAFGELFGFVGVLIAVPMTAVLKILGRVLLESYRRSGFFREAR